MRITRWLTDGNVITGEIENGELTLDSGLRIPLKRNNGGGFWLPERLAIKAFGYSGTVYITLRDYKDEIKEQLDALQAKEVK